MTFEQTIHSLESAGTAQNRKVYTRHGAAEPMYGVSFAHLGKLTKQIKTDHELAVKLWATGNHDARILATMIADPARLGAKEIDKWSKDLNSYIIGDAFAKLVARTEHAEKKLVQFKSAKSDFIGQAGWVMVALLGMDGRLSDDECESLIKQIEREIHDAPNRAKHSMNNALIAIGGSRPSMAKKAVAAARRIGKVEVDHGETGCKTPDAVSYIEKMILRKGC